MVKPATPRIQYWTQGFPSSVLLRHAQTTAPWILKRGGLERSGRRLISLNGKTKRIDFYLIFLAKFFSSSTFSEKKKEQKKDFFLKDIFQIF